MDIEVCDLALDAVRNVIGQAAYPNKRHERDYSCCHAGARPHMAGRVPVYESRRDAGRLLQSGHFTAQSL